ncbi:MAG: hypothetical protein U1F40_09965 [Turneriella sp.]
MQWDKKIREVHDLGQKDVNPHNMDYLIADHLGHEMRNFQSNQGVLGNTQGLFVGDVDHDGHLDYLVDANHDGILDSTVEAMGAFFYHNPLF